MDFTLQLHGAKYVFPIPDGLKELSSDIIREVLRQQPGNLCGFIADYLETMLIVRTNARDAGSVICDVFGEGYFFNELYRTKNITREQASDYATIIQASWRGYVIRRKISEWLKKKKKFEEEKERKKSWKIQELLGELGVTVEEATRAAGHIQSIYKESKKMKQISNEETDFYRKEHIPFGKRIREADRAMGRFDRWEKEDFGDFFEMDAGGAIHYSWPKIGQLRRVSIESVPSDALIVQFFGMRDLNGQEQYSYLIKSQSQSEVRGVPVGFLIPLPKESDLGSAPEIGFLNEENTLKMGNYTYIFRDDVEREDLQKFEDLLKARAQAVPHLELNEEFNYDPYFVLPRVLIRIKKSHLLPTDDEIKFSSLPEGIVCEQDLYTFRAENLELTAKIIRFILRRSCLPVVEALVEASNLSPYKVAETGRIFPVDLFVRPDYIQKINIIPESLTGNEESMDVMQYEYIFVPLKYHAGKFLPKGQSLFSIPIVRFEGFHSDYRGSADLVNQVFIMGPKLASPNGKPMTQESLFWDEFGIMAWHQLIASYSEAEEQKQKEEGVSEEEEAAQGEAEFEEQEEYGEEKEIEKIEEKIPTPKSEKQSVEVADAEPKTDEIEKVKKEYNQKNKVVEDAEEPEQLQPDTTEETEGEDKEEKKPDVEKQQDGVNEDDDEEEEEEEEEENADPEKKVPT